jgi:steroid 5-alpha reductase family enzyme/predicted DCC family thiol-disulfide oxidoreductase YuxK
MIFLFAFSVLFAFVFLAFFIAVIKKKKDIADIFWGIGFFIVSWTAFFLSEFSYNGLIVNILISIWSIRLSVHIYLRNKGRKEDFRYKKWKTKKEIFFEVFLLQGVILFIVSLPIIWIQTQPAKVVHTIPIFIWFIGFLLEAVSDYQLLVFKKNPENKEKLMMTGLWSYVRHPNYLGEIIQWWAIWMISLYLPFGFLFIVSPLLITLLIIFVSGVKPLEKKMKEHVDFIIYSEKTPSLMPCSLINGILYSASWFFVVKYGATGWLITSLMIAAIFYLFQLLIFYKFDRKSLFISIPISIFSLLLGVIQESFFIYTDTLSYLNQRYLPPLWILSLYPLFSLTLNSSLSFLNKNFYLAFFLGGIGSIFSYLIGEKLNGVILVSNISYVVISISWGIFLTLLLYLNKKMIKIEEKFTNSEKLKEPITVFFDISCPICRKEMEYLKRRKQTGLIYYATASSDSELKKMKAPFTYEESIQTIHGITFDGKILKGIDTLSAVYARTNLPLLAIFLQTPGFSLIFRAFYWFWAKIR